METYYYWLIKIFKGMNMFIVAFVIGFIIMMTIDIIKTFFIQIKLKKVEDYKSEILQRQKYEEQIYYIERIKSLIE